MLLFGLHRLVLRGLLGILVVAAVFETTPLRAQDAFLNEFHTDDRNGGYFDSDGDGEPDGYTDLEFVEFALHDDAPFDASDVLVLAYDGSGAYAGYAIGDPLWEAGEQQGDYRLHAFGPFRIPTASAPASPDRGAFPDGHGALALARWRADDTLELLDLISYGEAVTLTDDPWFGTVDATLLPVGETPAPASDTSGLNVYALGLAGALTPSQTATLRVRSANRLPAGGKSRRDLPVLTPSAEAAGSRARSLLHAKRARSEPRGAEPHRRAQRVPSAHQEAAHQEAAPDALEWMVFANTATPGTVNGNQSLPVALTALDVRGDGTAAVLTWQTASETNNAGFYVEHAHHTQPFQAVGFVEGAGTTARGQSYRFRVPALPPGTHTFRLRQVDSDGAFAYTETRRIRVAAPQAVHLTAPRPHPVTRATALMLTTTADQSVRVAVYDVMGRQVAVLHDGPVKAHAVYDVSFDPAQWALASGTYFVRATSDRHQHTRRIVVVR